MGRIIGPDVSFYQDSPSTPQGINFVKMRQVSNFVIIRAGQNLWPDSDFDYNWREAKAADLPRGSYWFYDSRVDPETQADLWYQQFNGDLGELPLFADLEESYNGQYKGWQNWRKFLERIKSRVGNKEIGIYTAYYYWIQNAPNPSTNTADLEYFHQYPLWIANYDVEVPLVPKPWNANEWLFWQFTPNGDGFAFGVESNSIDLNYFNGDGKAFTERFNLSKPEDPPPPPPPPPPGAGIRYRVTAGALNLREGPGTSFNRIAYVRRDQIVEELNANADRSWLEVRRESDGLTGWCSAKYLELVEGTPEPPPAEPGTMYRVTAGALNVREGPGTSFEAVGQVYRDEIVEALEYNSDQSWIHVRRNSDGLTGWSSAQYLVVTEEEPPSPPPPPPPPPPGTGDKYRVTAGALNVREGPSTSFNSIGLLYRDEIVEALEYNSDQSWIRIKRESDGLSGWSSASYLEIIEDSPPPPPPPPPPGTGDKYRVTAGALNVRKGPSTNFESVGFLVRNDIVEELDANQDRSWLQVSRDSDGLTGWCSAGYLEPIEDTPPPPPPPEEDKNWYEVTAGSLYVREGPNTNTKELGYLVRDEVVQGLETNSDNTWVKIQRIDGLTGWSSNRYLTDLGASAPESAMQKPFDGVTYYRRERSEPRRMVAHVLVIDKDTTGIKFLVTPPERKKDPFLCTSKTSEFLDKYNVQIAINGDGYRYFDPGEYDPDEYCPDGGDPVSPNGYMASRGQEYGEKIKGHPILYINQNSVISVDDVKGKLYNAISCDRMLIEKGKVVSGLDSTRLDPRTAVGFNQNGRWLYLVVVDGREASAGATFAELAEMLLSLGAYTAVALDGGGSSTMVIEGVDEQPRIVSTPIDDNIPGQERAVANHLGVYVKK